MNNLSLSSFPPFREEDNIKELVKLSRFTSLASRGFVLCRTTTPMALKIVEYYRKTAGDTPLIPVDMASLGPEPRDLQHYIAETYKKPPCKESGKSIFFLYNFELAFQTHKETGVSYLQKLNFIRDHFLNYQALFIFFMTEQTEKALIHHAFDFYDWMKGIFIFTHEKPETGQSAFLPEDKKEWTNPAFTKEGIDEQITYYLGRLEKETDLPRKARLFFELAKLYRQQPDYPQALHYCKKAIDLAGQLGDQLNLAASYNELALIYKHMGRLEEAVDRLQKAVSISEKTLDKNHPDLATVYNNLSTIYKEMDHLAEALEWQQKAVEIKMNVLDKNHPDLAASYNNLSMIYQGMGRFEDALEWQQKAVSIYEKTHDKNHPDLAISYNNLSMIYQDMGRLEEALDRQQKAVSIYEKTLDKNHPYLATSCNNLSSIYQDMGRLEEAIEYGEKAVVILELTFPNGHPYLDIAQGNLDSYKKQLKQKHSGEE